MDELDVHILGFSGSAEDAARGLMEIFGLEAAAAREFVASVPRVAKGKATPEEAERYVEALKEIGARVECRPTSPQHRTTQSELARRKREVEQETEDAVKRWRASEGREPDSEARAQNMPPNPRVPEDLMAHRAKVGWTDPPHLGRSPAVEDSLMGSWISRDPLDHVDGAPSSAPLELTSSTQAIADRGSAQRDSPHPVGPRRAVGMNTRGDDEFEPTRPGSLLSTRMRSGSASASGPGLRFWVLMIGLAALAALAYVVINGNSEERARITAWERQGITGGKHEPAESMLRTDGELRGLSGPEAAELVERFRRGGAVEVWAAGISGEGKGRVAGQLIVEMPVTEQDRRTVLWQGGRTLGQADPIRDEGQAYLAIPLPPK